MRSRAWMFDLLWRSTWILGGPAIIIGCEVSRGAAHLRHAPRERVKS